MKCEQSIKSKLISPSTLASSQPSLVSSGHVLQLKEDLCDHSDSRTVPDHDHQWESHSRWEDCTVQLVPQVMAGTPRQSSGVLWTYGSSLMIFESLTLAQWIVTPWVKDECRAVVQSMRIMVICWFLDLGFSLWWTVMINRIDEAECGFYELMYRKHVVVMEIISESWHWHCVM